MELEEQINALNVIQQIYIAQKKTEDLEEEKVSALENQLDKVKYLTDRMKIQFKPIGIIHSPFKKKEEIPCQGYKTNKIGKT